MTSLSTTFVAKDKRDRGGDCCRRMLQRLLQKNGKCALEGTDKSCIDIL